MASLDWFTDEALLRAREIYESFHPKARKDKMTANAEDNSENMSQENVVISY